MDPGKLLPPSNTLATPESAAFDSPRPYVSPGYNTAGDRSTLWDYWRILRKRKWTILSCLLVVMTLVTIATFRMTRLYQGEARIAIYRDTSEQLGFKDAPINSSGDDEDASDYTVALDTQAKILEGDGLALQVMTRLHLDQDPAFLRRVHSRHKQDQHPALGSDQLDTEWQEDLLKAFHEDLSVSKVPHTRLLDVKFLSPDPNLAATVTNTLANFYIENNFKTKFESTMQASDWLARQLSDLQMRVETSQERLVRYQKENGILGIDEKQNIITSKLDDLNRSLTAAQTERIQKEAAYKQTLTGDPSLIARLDANNVIEKLRENESDLQGQYAMMSAQFGPKYPKLLQLQKQIASLEDSIHQESTKLGLRIKNEYLAAGQREHMLQVALEQQKGEANRLNESSIQYMALKRDADTNRDLYNSLLQKMKEASVAAGMRSNNIRIVDVARVPATPEKPNIPLNLGLGVVLGLVGGVVLGFTLETLDNTIATPEEVTALSGLPSLGIVPLSLQVSKHDLRPARSLSVAGQSHSLDDQVALIALNRPNSEIAESYRALRTSLLLSTLGTPPKVIVVTSALPQEGKTTTSVNTAIVLAQKGGRVLLVDADMRRPSIHRAFNLQATSGLSTLLTGTDTLDKAVVPIEQLPNLDLLAGGPPPLHPAELLSSGKMRNFLAQWRDRYDHIVIDTPPMLSVTDAVLLSVEADAVVLILRSGQTTKDVLKRSRDLLTQVNARLMGVVVNAVDLQSPDAYYYYYGSRYAGRYYDEPISRN